MVQSSTERPSPAPKVDAAVSPDRARVVVARLQRHNVGVAQLLNWREAPARELVALAQLAKAVGTCV